MTTYYGGADIQPALDEFGVSVTVGAVTANALLEETDEEMLRDDGSTVVVARRSIVVKTATFPALVQGVAVTADGVSYKATSVRREEDGGVTRAYLERA